MTHEEPHHWALLPGWGMSTASLQPLAAALAPDRVTLVQWPDREFAWRAAHEGDWSPLRELLLEQVDSPALWLGWSLGALVLGRLSLLESSAFPARGVVFLGSGPRFVRRTPAAWGLRRAELRAFSQAFQRASGPTWQRFLQWQSSGETQPDECRRWLEGIVAEPKLEDHEILRIGLHLLGQLDFSSGLESPELPLLFLRGALDPLCPDWRELESQFSHENIGWRTVQDAGHVPQWGRSAALAKNLREWRGGIGR